MPPVTLSEAFFQKSAGWEAVQHARLLLAHGAVLSSNWSPPLLKGVVQSGDTSYRASLVIRSDLDIDNHCTCRQARELGTICPHVVAVGLHWLKPPPAPKPSPAATQPVGPAPSQRPGPSPKPVAATLQLQRVPNARPLSIHVVLPPNFIDSLQRGRLHLVLEGVSGSERAPLDAWARRGPCALAPDDEAVVAAAEVVARGNTPGMLHAPLSDALQIGRAHV